jgi:hypothetical protein
VHSITLALALAALAAMAARVLGLGNLGACCSNLNTSGSKGRAEAAFCANAN